MSILEDLRTASVEGRAKWDAIVLNIPDCPLVSTHKDEMLAEILRHLKMYAAAGATTATLYLDFSVPGGAFHMYFAGGVEVTLPDVLFRWWEHFEGEMVNCFHHSSSYAHYGRLHGAERVRKIRRELLLSAIHDTVNLWAAVAVRIPVSCSFQNENGWTCTFDWSEEKK